MFLQVCKRLGSVGFNPNISPLEVGHNPFTNHLLISWDIQVGPKICWKIFTHRNKWCSGQLLGVQTVFFHKEKTWDSLPKILKMVKFLLDNDQTLTLLENHGGL